jgi:hypothetical protein
MTIAVSPFRVRFTHEDEANTKMMQFDPESVSVYAEKPHVYRSEHGFANNFNGN